MKRLILFFALMTATVHAAVALSYDFTADNGEGVTICYKINDDGNSVTVTKNYDGNYQGTINIPQSVTNEGTSYTVTAIGDEAFMQCLDLTSITIPESVSEIEQQAFYGCTNLTTINLPDNLTKIGASAFRYCTSLTSITIPKDVTIIEKYAFYECTSLTSINLPDGLTTISNGTFTYCFSLANITLPNGITKIGEDAFIDCKNLQSISIPDNVEEIGNYAFVSCFSLKSITIPSKVEYIGSQTFRNCAFNEGQFINNSSLNAEEYNYWGAGLRNGNLILSMDGKKLYSVIDLRTTEESIPEGVNEICENAFAECIDLETITIPEGVTTIGRAAFGYCPKLATITIPSSVTYIGDYAFLYCGFNEGQFINNSSLNAEENNYWGAGIRRDNFITTGDGKTIIIVIDYNITDVTIPDYITTIQDGAFLFCSKLISITIPETVENIGGYAFYDCTFEKSKFINNSGLNAEENNYWGATIIDDSSITTIRHPSVNAELIATEYFSLNGQKLAAPQHGINIIRKTYSNGKTETQKVIIK